MNSALKPPSDLPRRRAKSPAVDDNARGMYQRQLNDRSYEVRLLELYEPSDPNSRHAFKCRLRYRTLSEAPSYAALSYCWGDMRDKQDLVIEGRAVQVSQNLSAALRQLWGMQQRLVWVDFLCINQDDNGEKSGQVRMMDTIYSKAQAVYAWLGPRSQDSDLAMAVLGASRRSEHMELPEEVEIACDAVIRLFSRPYFGRMWIIQELCRARSPILVCGQKYVPWGTMLKRLDMLGTSVPAQYAQHLVGPLRHMRYRDVFRFRADTETGLIPLLISSRRSLAGDPRDKLYALLSLAKDGRVLIPTPNYSQTPEQVFWDTTRCMIEDHDRTDVMLLAHRTRGERDLPSWVPDWANIRSKPPPWIEDCLAQKRGILVTHNRVHGNVLEVRGYRCDTIVGVLNLDDFGDEPITDSRQGEPSHWQSIAVNLCMGLSIGTEANHSIRAAVQVMRQICSPDATRDPTGSPFSAWVAHNGRRKVGSCTLQQHLDVYFNKINPGEMYDDETLEKARVTLEEGFGRLERLRMVFAVTRGGFLRVVYRAAKRHDQLYILQNCSLPVVLRAVGSERFRFIGEAFVSQHFLSTANAGKTRPLFLE